MNKKIILMHLNNKFYQITQIILIFKTKEKGERNKVQSKNQKPNKQHPNKKSIYMSRHRKQAV